MREKSASQSREIRGLKPALSQHRLPALQMEQMQGLRVLRLVLLPLGCKLRRSVVEAEGMEHFFNKIIVETA
ncbi:hypothetical protein D3C71_1896430 [compost metagenome]